MARTLYSEETRIESQPTAVKGLVLATLLSPEDRRSVFMEATSLRRAGSLKEAKERMSKEGWLAVSPEGFQRTIMCENYGHEYLKPEDLIWDPEAITPEMLLRDQRGYDGFVYRYGREIPLSTPLHEFICASSWNVNPVVVKAMMEHPWIRTDGQTYYVAHNGTSLNFQILLPQEVWDRLYREAKAAKKANFGSHVMSSCLLHGHPLKRDLLGLQALLRKPSGASELEEDLQEELREEQVYSRW